jgi:hypothetical protein
MKSGLYAVHVRNNKKKKKYIYGPKFKYGVQVPRNVRDALALDKANGDTKWADAIKKEIEALKALKCFEFRDQRPGNDYQKTTLVMIFEVKYDLRHKARLVAGGHLIDILDNSGYSSCVKNISVRLLHLIADQHKLTQLCGDVGNVFVNAYTNERVFAIAGLEFGDDEGKVVILVKALYGLAMSAEYWHSFFADFLRSIGFKPTRFDNDVWIKYASDKKSYEYICTHVDDFMIVVKDPNSIMKKIQDRFVVKAVGPPDYYLGNDYKRDKSGKYCYGCKRYLVEALRHVTTMFGNLKKHSTLLPTSDHPEEDNSTILSSEDHRKFQMLIGMLNWLVGIGRIDISHSVASLARFVACPRQGHLDRALQVFGYLKKFPNRRIRVDSKDPCFIGSEETLNCDLTII